MFTAVYDLDLAIAVVKLSLLSLVTCWFGIFQYLEKRYNLDIFTGNAEEGVAIVADIIVVCITLIKLGGTDYIVKVSGAMFAISMIPATVFIVYGAKDLEPKRFIDFEEGDEGIETATLVTWVNWMYAGFLSLGSLAGEASNPAQAYPTVVREKAPVFDY